jgi:hypothetical protein
MGARIDVTPAEAKARWEELGRPSLGKVAEAFKSESRTISRNTLALWSKNDWKTGQPESQPKPNIPAAIEADGLEFPIIEAAAASDGELVRQTARQALDAARRVFHTLAHLGPAALLEKSIAAGALAEKMAKVATLATEALARANDIAAGTAKPVIDQAATRSRDDDPLAPALDAYENALREGAPH